MKKIFLLSSLMFCLSSYADANCEKMIQEELAVVSNNSLEIRDFVLDESKSLSSALKVFEVNGSYKKEERLGFHGISTWYAIVRVLPVFEGDSKWKCDRVEAMIFGSRAL